MPSGFTNRKKLQHADPFPGIQYDRSREYVFPCLCSFWNQSTQPRHPQFVYRNKFLVLNEESKFEITLCAVPTIFVPVFSINSTDQTLYVETSQLNMTQQL